MRPLAFAARKLGLKRLPVPDSIFNRLSEARTSNDGIDVIAVERTGDEFDRLWEQLRSYYEILAVRDRAWVQWRYLDAPDVEQCVLLARRGGEACGYLAYRIHRDVEKVWAVILDCFAAPHDHLTTRALLAAARRALWGQGVESVAALAPLKSPLEHELRRAGFWQQRRGYDFYIIRYGDDFRHEPRDWFLTGAEGDVV
jgi:hypothetical protein